MLLLLTAAATAVAACGSSSGGSVGGVGGAGGEQTSADAGASHGELASGAGGGGASEADVGTKGCQPSSKVDEPDERFLDENCDGIDGDVERGIFVSPDGFDRDDGSIDRPVQSLARAVALAKIGRLAVYVCNGTYRENVVVDAPLSIYGGYDCTRDWKRIRDIAIFESGAGLPLLVDNVDGKVHLERLAFRAAPGVAAGQSSQAAAIVGSSDVSLDQVTLTARDGVNGGHGVSGADAPLLPPRDSARGSATTTTECFAPESGGSPGTYCDSYATGGYSAALTQRCASGFEMRGGAGAAGGNVWLAMGKPSCFERASDVGLQGSYGEFRTGDGMWKRVSAGNSGLSGADGVDGAAAGLGVGSISMGVYAATNAGEDGAPGQPGWPGRGGAGGRSVAANGDVCGSFYTVGSGGGQGGLGGCAGDRATGGMGGGGSIALVVVDSVVMLSNVRFSVGDGGAGGDGAQGGAAQPGAAGAAGGAARTALYEGQQGQPGGDGGLGGDGGPGGGGPSIAILYTGATPEVTDAVYELGSPGDGGLAFSGPNGPDGLTGELISLDELSEEQP